MDIKDDHYLSLLIHHQSVVIVVNIIRIIIWNDSLYLVVLLLSDCS